MLVSLAFATHPAHSAPPSKVPPGVLVDDANWEANVNNNHYEMIMHCAKAASSVDYVLAPIYRDRSKVDPQLIFKVMGERMPELSRIDRWNVIDFVLRLDDIEYPYKGDPAMIAGLVSGACLSHSISSGNVKVKK
jgi:hypothetical protein